MTRDSESLIELLICALLAAMLTAGYSSKQWLNLDSSAEITSSHSIFIQSDNEPYWLRKTSNETIKVQKVSGLIELNDLLFAKPLGTIHHKSTKQAC
ncbi:MAG: hypothetical protein AAF446_10805 [Pseudomonadota bacterium]